MAGRRQAVFTDFFERVQPAAGARLLDVGCGTGDFLLFARARSWHPTGIDLSERAAAQARARVGSRRAPTGRGCRPTGST